MQQLCMIRLFDPELQTRIFQNARASDEHSATWAHLTAVERTLDVTDSIVAGVDQRAPCEQIGRITSS